MREDCHHVSTEGKAKSSTLFSFSHVLINNIELSNAGKVKKENSIDNIKQFLLNNAL